VNEDVENILSSVNGLSEHLDAIYELEMFYGEPVIQSLIDHMKAVQEEIESYMTNNNDIEELEDAPEIEE
jgi:spore cortex formation protein SpoVR/YcgB (stage V sporulation)